MKKFLVTLLTLIIIAMIGLVGYTVWKLNDKVDDNNNKLMNLVNELKDDHENIKNSITTNNAINSNTNASKENTNSVENQTTSTKTNEEIIKDAYLEKLKSTYTGYKEYRIDGVKVLTDQEKADLIKSLDEYKSTDILAVVNYSLKPQTTEGYIVAGNGEISGDWIINKSACVCYRDGRIASEGTGW